MPPVLTVIRWRDIPAQVTAKDGRAVAKRVLHRRFQVAIDRAAMKAGKKAASDYIGEWVSDRRPCSADLQAEVDQLADRFEAEHTREVLARLIANGGWTDPSAHSETPPAESSPAPETASTAAQDEEPQPA
jgi:NAD(P)-dependent dehydrogenase (short-subunit alcohol dehydrogenase family)